MEELPSSQRLRDFQYHQVSVGTAQKMADIRTYYYALAETLLLLLPTSHEQSLALTSLEESCMRAIQCLAVAEGTPVPIGETWTDSRDTGRDP